MQNEGIIYEGRMYISVPDMAMRLGISRANAYRLSHVEGFPKVLIGTRILIPVDELDKYLKENREIVL